MSRHFMNGVFDMHVHSHPDVAPRKADDIDLARAAAEAGMGGLLLKAHHGSTVERAYLTEKIVPNIRVFGGVVLNYPVGGLNPHAVDIYVRLGAKEVWMPTLSAEYMIAYQKAHVSAEDRLAFHKAHGVSPIIPKDIAQPGDPWPWSRNGHGISVFDERGKLVQEVWNILEILAASDAILGTGHLSVPETYAVVEAAQQMGVKRILVTHPEYMAPLSVEEQIFLARRGVFFERCFVGATKFSKAVQGDLPFDVFVRNIREVGIESTVLGTDFGQAKNEHPVIGMEDYLQRLHQAGFSESEIECMGTKTPAVLLNIS